MSEVFRLGYACINLTLGKKAQCSRTCRLSTLQNKFTTSTERLDYLISLSISNLNAILLILDFNHAHNIFVYRLTSGIFPHISNNKLTEQNLLTRDDFDYYYTLSSPNIRLLIHKIADKAQEYNMRLSFHPSQFNNFGSPHASVIENSILDVSWHCHFLNICDDYIRTNADADTSVFKDSVVILHGGGTYKNKITTMEKWCETFTNLPREISKWIVLENDEKCYNVMDLLPICERLNIPLLFDIHHYNCFVKQQPSYPEHDLSTIFIKVIEQWQRCDNKRPKFHLSEQSPGKKCGAHSDYISIIPSSFFEYIPSHIQFDIMLECKMKEKALLNLIKSYL